MTVCSCARDKLIYWKSTSLCHCVFNGNNKHAQRLVNSIIKHPDSRYSKIGHNVDTEFTDEGKLTIVVRVVKKPAIALIFLTNQ